jgi:protein-disulfide isomerase
MSNAASNSKRARRDHAREAAREMREKERKRHLRNRILLQGGVAVAIIAVAVVVVLILVQANRPAGPGPANMASDSILITGVDGEATVTESGALAPTDEPTPISVDNADGSIHIVEYVDWSCPVCATFHESYGEQIEQLVASGDATLEVHPVAILDSNYAPARYSSRAMNAAACVANYEPDSFLAVQDVFYTQQPAEGTAGLANSEIKDLIHQAGVESDDVDSCVDDESFKAWVTASTQRATQDVDVVSPESGRLATPTVFVNGERWPNSGDFMAFAQEAVAAAQSTGTPTPTPTSTETGTPTPEPTETETAKP